MSDSTSGDGRAHHWYARPVLFVADAQSALRFYVGKLGFTQKWASGEGTVCQVDRGGCEIILCEDRARQDRSRLFVELTRDGIDELRRELAERSASMPGGLSTCPRAGTIGYSRPSPTAGGASWSSPGSSAQVLPERRRFAMPASSVNGIRIYWEISGDVGDPIVLVHGSWGDHRNWAPVVPALSQRFRVLTYDRRGHSKSERPAAQGSVREDVADLAALLEMLPHAPAHVVGNSFGASIVLRLAAQRPELFRSLIVHEPPLFGLLKDAPAAVPALAAVQQRLSAVAALLIAGDATEGARLFVDTIAFGPGAWAALPPDVRETFVFNAPTWLDEFNDPEALEIDLGGLRRVAAPALLTIGDQSAPFFPPVVNLVASAIPEARTRTYAGAGHVPHLSHPAEYVEVVTTFIDASA